MQILRRNIINYCLIIFILMYSTGCATFNAVGTRTVKHSVIRDGPISQDLNHYNAPEAVRFPSENDQTIILKFTKVVDKKIKYRTPTHEEKILKREVTEFQSYLEMVFSSLNDDYIPMALYTAAVLPICIVISPLFLFMGSHEETQYELIPGLESEVIHYHNETDTYPASDIKIELHGIEPKITDTNGLVSFSVSPAFFDRGVSIFHGGSSQTYIIKRSKHYRTREYKAPWRDEAQITSTAFGTIVSARKIKYIASLGGGPVAIAGAVLFDIVTGLAVGYIIDVAASRTEKIIYYRWSILLE